MRSFILLPVGVVLLVGCSVSYAGGDYSSQTRELPSFDRIEASRGVEVTVACGETTGAVLKGDAKALADLDLRVEGHTLIVRRGSMFDSGHWPVHVALTANRPLDKLEASSGSSIDAPACAVTGDRIALEASSGGTLHVAAKSGHLSAEASSGGTIGLLPGGRIDVHDADIHASSGGSVRICSTERLSGHASSGGSITSESWGSGDRSSSSGGDFSTRSCS